MLDNNAAQHCLHTPFVDTTTIIIRRIFVAINFGGFSVADLLLVDFFPPRMAPGPTDAKTK